MATGERHFYGGAFIKHKQVPWPLARLTVDRQSVSLEPTLPWLPIWRVRVRALFGDLASVERTSVGFLKFTLADAGSDDFSFVTPDTTEVERMLGEYGVAVSNPWR